MKILFLLFSFTVGGTERLVTDICNYMSANGQEVHLYVVNRHYDDALLAQLSDKVHLTLQNRTPGAGSKLDILKQVASYICKHNIQIVHCNSLYTPELLLLAKLRRPSLQVVYTIHGMHQYESLGKSKVLLRNMICKKLIAISDAVAEDMVQAGADKKKLVTVHNAIDFARFTPKQTDICNYVLGNVARIMPECKGQDVLLEALPAIKAVYPQMQCLFAGEADREHQPVFEQLKQRTKDLGLENNVTFLGTVVDVPAFLEGIDVFVLPSRSEGFGISLIEAMASGLPVAATDLDGPREVLEAGRLGHLFPSEDHRALSETILAVFAQYSAEKQSAMENISRVQSKYGIKSMCQKLLEIYRDN